MTTVIAVPVTTVWTSPDAPREQDAPITARVPDPVDWNTRLLPEPPSALWGRTDTQALLGEPVEVVDDRSGWLQVNLPWQPSSADLRGYPGWVPAAHVTDSEVPDASPRLIVTTPTARVGPLALSYGTMLPVVDRATGAVRVAVPDGTAYTAPPELVALPDPSETPDIDSLLTSAGRFTGMRYLWGGTSGWGFDCSGFVHLVHRRYGLVVPRDAFDQADAATPVELDAATCGDLYFFRKGGKVTHVGFTTNKPAATPEMLHAPDSGDAQLTERAPLPPERLLRLAAAGTFLPRPA